jgi:hypothetical protein
VPLLTLGIPTSVTAAILLSAFQNYGINPGRSCSRPVPALVWALIASLYIGNVMLLVLNLPLVGLWVKLLKIPRPPLYAGILIFATVGVYGMRQSAFDLCLMYGIGLLGVVMRRFDFPTAPVIVGMILGPLAEAQMRNALSIGEGHWSVFVQRPMSADCCCRDGGRAGAAAAGGCPGAGARPDAACARGSELGARPCQRPLALRSERRRSAGDVPALHVAHRRGRPARRDPGGLVVQAGM